MTPKQRRKAGLNRQSPLSYAVRERDRYTLQMVRDAVARGDTLLAYQPVMLAGQSGRVAFYEGLIRVLDETGRVIPAKDFIDTIETQELGRIIDCLALEEGLATLAEQPSLRLSINMSARSIGYPRWNETLRRGIANHPMVAERLILEITESSAMIMPDLVTVFMQDLQRKGISFALDDFGSGYTSFRYLKEFYFDIIKIDHEFIRDIHKDPNNQVLTNALVSIAQHFDMFTVAEGVETAEEAQFLTAAGLDCLQGYYFAAPMTVPPWARAEVKRASV